MTSDAIEPKLVPPEPIAICGMSVRLPGGLHTPQQLWDFLIAKGDARGQVPKSRYNASAYYSDPQKPSSIKTEYGYFLDESIDIASMDTSFFTMGKLEVSRMDPQQRQMLEVARECMEDAGETNWKGRPIGCYMGSFGEDWLEICVKEPQQYGQYRASGHGDFMLPNRISYEMDLMGPSMLMRTGCSASLVALHEACLAISRGDCEGAIVGGANLIMAPGMTAVMTEQGVLSPDGSCKTFSADANGYARGEAISAIFIKPLVDAIRDKNPVRAVIRATASNSDGRGVGIGSHVPYDISHEAMIRRAYEVAGIVDYSQTAFVECHGTGTPVGDPIETRAVGRVFGPSGGVLIGSVKPNLGHSEGASGITALIKSILALENRVIPPNIKLNEPNPKIQWDDYGLSVPTEPMPWPETRSERISVNSFGIGGTNAHVILDSAQSFGVFPAATQPPVSPQLLVYSANNFESLKKMILHYTAYVQKNPARVADLAFTLANKREHLSHRAFSVKSPLGQLTTSAPAKAGEAPNIVMVFTGQGAQWPQMGGSMIHNTVYPAFKKSIQDLDSHLQTLTHPPEWNIEEELLKDPNDSRLSSSELSQPLCTAIQVALIDTLASVGVQPAAVVGHSSGEVAAAYAAGALTANEAITIAFYRGQATKLQTRPGAMAAIGMGTEEVQEYLQPGVIIACENSPKSVTLTGDADAIENAVSSIKEAHPDVMARQLKVDKAYHSHHMTEIGDKLYAFIEHEISATAPKKLFFSTVENKLLTEAQNFGPKYWQMNLQSPVLFRSAVSSILKHQTLKNMVLFEIGPHSALAGPLRQIQSDLSTSSPYISTFVRNQDSTGCFLTAIGQLHVLNAIPELNMVISEGSTLPDLPRYPWDHSKRFWHESRLSKEWRHREHKYHDLLGVRVTESPDFHPLFRNLFHLENAPWIRDHKVGDDIVFPFAGYAAMIGEAVRQLTGVNEAFKIRNVIVSTALVLNEGPPVEILTTLHRHRLTDSLDSEWWEFTITSHNGASWTKHCSGEARSHSEHLENVDKEAPLVRKVSTRRCYHSLAMSGLNFGPSFRRLDDVRSDTLTQNATSELVAKETDGEDYHLHPTVIDASLQLLSIAASKGYIEQITGMMIPTHIQELSIYRCYENVQVQASASYTPNGSILGGGQCITAGGKVVLRSSGIKLSMLDHQDSDKAGHTACAEWAPHIDFLDVTTLIKPLIDRSEYMPALIELSHLCMIYTQRVIAELDTSISHMHKYRTWIDHYLLSVDLQSLQLLDNTAIQQRVKELIPQFSQTNGLYPAVGIEMMFNNIQQIFTGEVEALDLLLADHILAKFYDAMDQCNISEFIKQLSHSKPNLRILEIGAGTGGSTANILKMLTPGKRNLYMNYTFTDISSGFFVAAKERFKNYPNLEYATLDISKDPSDQGFDGRQYDLILATNVIHATASLKDSLSNVRKLISPTGWFLLHELTPTSKWINYIFGTLPGWWYGDADGRSDDPYVGFERWAKELKSAGFRTPDAAVSDSAYPHQLNTMIVTRPEVDIAPKKCVTLLTISESRSVDLLLHALENRGYSVYHARFGEETLPDGQDVISLLDDDAPFFENMDNQRFDSFKKLVQSLEKFSILWVTRLSQTQCRDPRFAQINGISRTIRSELLVNFATCEIDNFDVSLEKLIDVYEKFQVHQEDETLKPDFEYAIVDNTVLVSRYHLFSLQDEQKMSDSTGSMVLRTSKPGRLATLHWAHENMRPLKGNEVEIDTYAIGLNFKDILCAMAIVEANDNEFGNEGGGIVRRIGPEVQDLKAGDRVMVAGKCLFGTQLVVSENLCEKIPGGLSFNDAATMPCVFTTSIYSIIDVGNLKKGQSILIHSACGGVGIATIQLAQMIGAEIYATVGNEEKVKYLMETFGLPRNRIFNSRNTSFVEDIMRETNGQGVDLALNSLSGELLHATWKCIAPFGKMVEIGKRDLIGSGKLDMSPFLYNRSYCCVDLDQLWSEQPTLGKKLLKRIVVLLRERYISPIRPIKIFSSDGIHDAFRYMQQGIHLGKIVVSMRDNSGHVSAVQNIQQGKRSIQLNSSDAYLLVGGLGGLGRAISMWMVKHGARHLIYLSRTAGTSEDHRGFAQELASMGCHADFVRGSVSNLEDVENAISQAQGRLRGILQMSMALCDRSFTSMTLEEWNTAVDPKVKGTWNLHNASVSANAELDFFVLFSSVSGLFGLPGQINYSGANTFLDAFSQYRLNLGLPACAIDIGLVGEVGYTAEQREPLLNFKTAGIMGTMISESEFLIAIEAAMTSVPSKSRSSFGIGIRPHVSMADQRNRLIWKKDIRMSVFYNSAASSSTLTSAPGSGLGVFIAQVKGDVGLLSQPESAQMFALEIGKKVFSFLLKPEENLVTSCSLPDLGMDSLVAIEMKQWWKTTFGFDISVLELMGMGTIDMLGEHAARGMLKLFHGVHEQTD
ncbi:uncharacterized protein N7479_005010 [Penicillium vulpinum]|uniref:Uncharacterized protein n=1 Tax=Penicillium vulpinum TaxID=29845 RepID=A0A1V6RMF3_9EURO|nr:uncharacterized protein N7479_005010 [Penicillium vulpinum]KAJ5965134.1 hypothetical protein N7479_005010 [Penicillium vulpinum]OQE03001.1 hypothetical protein PENVUL_c036G07551 [Penicillium vulpinum]